MKSRTGKLIIKLNKARILTAAVCLALFFVFAVSGGLFGLASPFSQTTKAYAAAAETNEYGFAGGDGSKSNPFIIETAAQLDNVRKFASNNVIINNNGEVDGDDIPDDGENESDGDENSGSNVDGYVPIGEYNAPAYHFKVIRDIDMEEYLSEGGDGYEKIEEKVVPKWDEDSEDIIWVKEYEKWGENGWLPIAEFSGVFDGGGYTISNLWINRPDDYSIGLFGYCASSTIKNITLELGVKGIIGRNYVGGIAAKLYNQNTDKSAALVSGCSVMGNITAANRAKPDEYDFNIMAYAGGIVGEIYNGTVTQCMFSGTVSGLCAVGGIAGVSYKGDISDCLSYGKINLTSTKEHIPVAGAGGIVGISYGGAGDDHGDATIKNCFYENTQTDIRVAAIVGFRKDIDAAGRIINQTYAALPKVISCYYNGSMFSGSLTHIEDLVEFDNSEYGGGMFSQPFEPVNSGALNAKQMKKKASYKGWDFVNTWGFDKNKNLILRAVGNAYDPPSLVWLWVTLGCTLFGAAAVSGGLILYRRKKTEIITKTITETNIITEIVEKEVYKEIPVIKKPLPNDLSKREKQVAELLLQGKDYAQIADILGISEGTVGVYLSRVYTKTGVDSQKEFLILYSSGE